MKNRREINKLEIEMSSLTALIKHTPDPKAKMLYADKLLSITPTYIRLVYDSQQLVKELKKPNQEPRVIYFYEGGSRE